MRPDIPVRARIKKFRRAGQVLTPAFPSTESTAVGENVGYQACGLLGGGSQSNGAVIPSSRPFNTANGTATNLLLT